MLAPAEWIALAQRSDGVTEPGPGERLAGEMSRPASSPSEWVFNEHVVDAENLTFELSRWAGLLEGACLQLQASNRQAHSCLNERLGERAATCNDWVPIVPHFWLMR